MATTLNICLPLHFLCSDQMRQEILNAKLTNTVEGNINNYWKFEQIFVVWHVNGNMTVNAKRNRTSPYLTRSISTSNIFCITFLYVKALLLMHYFLWNYLKKNVYLAFYRFYIVSRIVTISIDMIRILYIICDIQNQCKTLTRKSYWTMAFLKETVRLFTLET